MDKAPDAYRTISEVAEDLDLPQHVLRFWETRFSQIKPLKRGGGRRYYRPDDVELLKGIRHLLYKEGYTIKGVQRILKEQGPRAVQAVARPPEVTEWDIPVAGGEPALTPAEPQADAAVLAAPLPETLFVSAPSSQVQPRAGFSEARAYPVMPPITPPAIEPYMTTSPPADAEDEANAEAPDRSAPFRQPVDVAGMPENPWPAEGVPAMQARGQVSMFRGGLQRGESGPASGPMADFANGLRDRIEQALEQQPQGGSGFAVAAHAEPAAAGQVAPAHGPTQEQLVRAFEDLVACRTVIDRVLARRVARG